ncbi:MAG: hypothetical protein KGM42_10295 [Hyphomicrobiales bacterium]|nr:hypothetical protein [Hyphomicrobiales bacterium]
MTAADLVADMRTFLALTLVIGGAGAFVTGRAMALTWRSQWLGVAYMLPLACAVRFLHYALFQEPTTVPQAILCFAILALAALGGFAVARRSQMIRQYPWIGAQEREL